MIPRKSQPRTLDLRRMTTTPAPPRAAAAPNAPATTVALLPPAVGTPVSGAPSGTELTCPGAFVATGAAVGS
jgi:hypothetical protein